MNEQPLLNESPHTGEWRVAPAKNRPSADGGSQKRLLSLAGFAHSWRVPALRGAFSLLAFLLVWAGLSAAHAQPTVDLSVRKAVSNQSPAIGDVITYTVVVANAPGSTTATNVTVKDELLAAGVSFVPASASTVRGSGTFTSATSATLVTGTWRIPAITPGDSAVLVFKATVLAQGVWFGTAEVTAVDQTDVDSPPNNQNLLEDDYDAVCFSIPIFWYPGDEYTVSVPSGYDQIVWYKDDAPISTSAVSTSLAVVNPDLSLTIKSPGVYRFETFRNGCKASNCCNIELIQGPYGSLGDLVFVDTNRNGKQDDGATGIDGVKILLYKDDGTTKLDSTVTAGGGKYLFGNLTDGKYIVRFVAPTGYQSTSANAAGTTDDLDSDAGANGYTGVYTIDTSKPESSTARNNPTVDAGYYLPNASLGNFVWYDTNGNGLQDTGETGVPNVTVSLLSSVGAPLSTTTSNTGFYSFTGLTPGVSYTVVFSPTTLPASYTFTGFHLGADTALDSDADPVTGASQPISLTANETNVTIDAGIKPLYDVGIAKTVVSNGPYYPGNAVAYQLTVTNNSPVPVYNVQVDDLLPTGVSFVSGAGFAATGVNSASTVVAGPIPANGGTVSLTLTAQIGLSYAANSVLNTAVVSRFTATTAITGPTPTDTKPNNNTATVTVPVGNLASLGDFVWEDKNANGLQEAGEPGINGVFVTLLTPTGSLTTTTANSGLYSFTGLTPGVSYTVSFSTPTGFTATQALAGTDRTVDSNVNPATGTTAPITLQAGENNVTIDAGFFKRASLGDKVFADNNRNGIQDNGDTPIAGVKVTLYINNVESLTTLTDASGIYSFTGLTPGTNFTYVVGFSVPAGFTATTPLSGTDKTIDSDVLITGRTGSVTLTSGESNMTVNAGFLTVASLGDKVFADDNRDGLQQNTEPGIPGVVVVLLDGTNSAVASTTTNSSGIYSFTGLTPGVPYSVSFVAPAGYVSTSALVGTDRTIDSDPDPLTGKTASLTLAAGQDVSSIDAGFFVPGASLGDFVWYDTNGNGQQDTGETAVANVTVSIYKEGRATPVASQTTGADGKYLFTNLTPGIGYYVVFAPTTLPNGFTLTQNHQGNDATDSDADPVTGKTGSYTLAAGEVNRTVDAGLKTLCPSNFSLVVSSDASICNGEKVNLIASTPLPGTKIYWYLTPFDGVALATLESGQPFAVNPTTTTVYYAEVVTVVGSTTCTSARKPVVVTVTTVPTPICLGNTKNTCPATTVDLTKIQVENETSSFIYEWYTSLSRSQATRVTNLTAVGGGKYYLFAKSGNCYSNPTVLTVEIADCNCQNVAGVSVGPGVVVCSGAAVPLKAVLSGSATSVTWSSSGTGMFSAPNSLTTTYTPSAADVASGAVLLTATTNDSDGGGICKAATSSLIAKINKPLDAPVGVASDDALVCLGNSTKLVGYAPGAQINWYDADGKLIATTQSGSKLVVTPTKAGSAVYSAEAVSPEGCISGTRSSVTVTVGSCLADLAVVKKVVTPGPYTVGQKVTYAISVTNKGKVTATSVNVSELLPATLTYVSATPAGEYNAGTGMWTVGTLAVGSNRNLLVEATINAAGTIKNTAMVSSPENDPNPALALDDTSSAIIDVNSCALQAMRITCALSEICKGNTATLKASACDGTVKWSDGQTGLTVDVTPMATTTYSASCVLGRCVSPAQNTMTITVRDPQIPTITASAGNVCSGASVTLTAAGCEGGTIEWSDKTQKGASIVVNPTAKTTYTAQCRMGSCVSNPATKTIDMGTDLPTPTITCSTTVICPGEHVTLTVNNCQGTPVWNSTTETTNSIVVTPTAAMNSYTVYCTNGTCVSKVSRAYSISVVTPAITAIVASADTICTGAPVSLTAMGCSGTVLWNATDKNGVVLTGSVITVNPDANISYYAQCKYRTCLSEQSEPINIVVASPQTPQISLTSGKNVVCSGEKVTLTAEGCTGIVKWYGVDKLGASIDFFPTETKDYYATCRQGSCESEPSLKIRVTVNTSSSIPAPRVASSTTAVCGGGVVSLTATGCTSGTVIWSDGQVGPVAAMTATTTNNEFYAICRIGTQCGSARSNVIRVRVTPTPTPTVTASADSICSGEPVTLTVNNCQGTPVWSTQETTSSITVAPTATTAYTVYCKDGACTSETAKAYTITVMPVAAPTITASATAVQPGGTISLTATGCAGEVIWSASDINGNNKGSVIVVRPQGPQTYYAQCRYHECLSDSSTAIRVNKGNCNVAPPVLNASSLTVCYGTKVTLNAPGCDGGVINWSDGSVGASIERVIYSDLWLMATCTIDGCTSEMSRSIDVRLGTPGVPTIASSHPTVCVNESVTLTATGCEGGTYIWSDGKTTGTSLTVTPTADVTYRVKCRVGTCDGQWSPYTTIKVGAPAAPTITVAESGTATVTSATVCNGSPVTLTALGCPAGNHVAWSNDQTGTSITVTPVSSVTYTARCCSSDNCKGDQSNVVSITVLPKVPQPLTIDRTNTCPFNTVDLTTAVSGKVTTTGGVFEYYTSASLSRDTKVPNPAAVGAGTYYVVEKTANGCYSLPGEIHVLINTACGEQAPCDANNPATASAGADASICAAKTYQLAGVMGGAGKTAHWSTSGTGRFDNPYALNATYSASAEDVLSGKVTLTLSVSTNNASCPVAKDDMVLTIEGSKSVPTVKVIGATTLCYGDSVTLQAPAGATYLWSNKAKTQSIVVKSSGSYSVQLFDPNGCSSVKSQDVVVTVPDPTATPLVANLRNTCPATVANLTSAVSAPTTGSTYEYRLGTSASSAVIMRPDSVGAGTFYVFAKSKAGCVSAPAKVVVNIFNCMADSLTTDVSITKTASTTLVKHGEPVTYTIKVNNLGKHTAKNIDVRDVLPKGLELVTGAAAGYTVSNGILSKRIDSLKAGQSDSIVFRARVVVKGTVVNKAEITYLDQKDTNPANNTSSVAVKDTAAYKPSLIGLAKSVIGTPTTVGDSLVKMTYGFVVRNFGDDTLRKVQITDDLAYFAAPNKVVSAIVRTPGKDVTLKLNPTFTGTGSNTNLFDSTSYLAPNRSQTFTLDVTVRRAKGDTTRAFRNIASASALNSLTAVSDLSVSGANADPDGDGNPTNNTGLTSFTLGVAQPGGPSIGLALAIVKVSQQADSSYNVTYKATVRNFGDVDLVGLSLTDSLVRTFASPVSYTVVGTPKVASGSTLVANSAFDGNTQPNLLASASGLAAGALDSVFVTVNVRLRNNKGPFVSNAIVAGHTTDSTQTVIDISNNGFDPTPAGAVATPVRFDLPKGLLGVAKSVGTPTLVEEGVYDIPYTITLSNMGTVALKKVQVVDNLSETFGHGALIVSNRIRVYASAGLRTDTLYTGQGLITKMLVDSASTLAVGANSSLNFTVRVNVKNADSLRFYNSAKATALTGDNQVVEDMSTAGTNSDPDHDLDPRNNSQSTPIVLNNALAKQYIGVAMAVRDTVRQSDGSFNVTYQIVVKNYGRDPLTKVVVSDTLSRVFNSHTGATFTLVKAPITTSTGSTLKLNPAFNGASDPLIVFGDSTSWLAAGKMDTILVVVNVATNGSTTTFLNSAYAMATSKTGTVWDASTSGLNPDLNGNGNPTDPNEREATPLNLPAGSTVVFIPQGFSPNGDGINDLFVIRGMAGLTVSLEVYNRWGHLVYRNEDYHNDWDGKPNTGIAIDSDANGLPDGTYYYVIKTSDGRKFVRYMTINR